MLTFARRRWFEVCRSLGGMLRSARYTQTMVMPMDAGGVAIKRRMAFAPFLIWLSGPLMRVLGAGVRVLPQREWVERERMMYATLYGAPIRVDGTTLELKRLPGQMLAMWLVDHLPAAATKLELIGMAAAALADLHRRGFTHGDAMAENVIVDLEAGVARWVDFETVHDERRSLAWRRADDVRALLATTWRWVAPAHRAQALRVILERYGDPSIQPELVAAFTREFSRALPFHLGQAALTFDDYGAIAGLLGAKR